MNAINVNKQELLTKVRTNRERHRKIFLEAQAGYRAAAIVELDKMIKDARDGKQIQRMLGLIQPMDQTRDYDRAIAMLEMSVDETVKLDEENFKCYVLDQWHWQKQWSTSNRGYSKTLSDSMPADEDGNG